VADFARVATAAPQSPVRATAEYDAAAALISLKDWMRRPDAGDFRQRYPGNPLQEESTTKLAVVYVEKKQWALAAPEFERLAASKKDPQLARGALWQAASCTRRPVRAHRAARTYERYVKQNPAPLGAAVEARYRWLAWPGRGRSGRRAWLDEGFAAGRPAGGSDRTDRTRYLGATAALALAKPVYEEYRRCTGRTLESPAQAEEGQDGGRLEVLRVARTTAWPTSRPPPPTRSRSCITISAGP